MYVQRLEEFLLRSAFTYNRSQRRAPAAGRAPRELLSFPVVVDEGVSPRRYSSATWGFRLICQGLRWS